MSIELIIFFGIYFAVMLLIGWYVFRKIMNINDYMLGGRGFGLFVMVLFVGAVDMSVWMLMGVFGVMFVMGLLILWLVFGLMIGVYLNYLLFVLRFCVYMEVVDDVIMIFDFFDKWFCYLLLLLKIVFVVIIMIFFILYILFGMVFGGRLFELVFGVDYKFGLFLMVGVVVFYMLFGGFFVVSLIDFV